MYNSNCGIHRTVYTTFTTGKLRIYDKKREITIIKSLITQKEATEVAAWVGYSNRLKEESRQILNMQVDCSSSECLCDRRTCLHTLHTYTGFGTTYSSVRV